MGGAQLTTARRSARRPAHRRLDVTAWSSNVNIIATIEAEEAARLSAKGGKIPGVRTPIVIDGAPMAAARPSPRLGEHTAEILREIGEA